MRLSDLEPQFVKAWTEDDCRHGWEDVQTIAEADGVWFLCPKCFETNGGAVGTHRILCWSPSVPIDMLPKPGRWHLEGSGYADLTLRGVISDSVLLTSGCGAHFFVRSGRIETC